MEKGSQTPITGTPPRNRKPPSKKTRRNKNATTATRIHHIEQALVSTIKKAYIEMFGVNHELAKPFTLDLKMVINPKKSWQLITQPALEEQIYGAIQEMAVQTEIFHAGRVYCYRCDSSVCLHSLPPGPSTVFGGYSSTGLPVWPELTEVLLSIKHPRVDLLYHPSQHDLVAAYIPPEMLKRQQLNVFGKQSKTYNILGQVVFGFLNIFTSDKHNKKTEQAALTIQAVETRRLNGAPMLELNILSRLADGSPTFDALTSPYQIRIQNILISTRHRINSLNPSSKTTSTGHPNSRLPDKYIDATKILQALPRKLEKVSRQKNRRTTHAEGGRVNNRPTFKAWDDISEMSNDFILWDRHQNTYIVLGPRNRIHVFSPVGRHITSFALTTDAVQSRLRRKRWRKLTSDQQKQFKATVVGSLRQLTSQPGR